MNAYQLAKNLIRWTTTATLGLLWIILYATTVGHAMWKLTTWAWSLWP